ncbi:DUF4158 domain-containing protein [Streptomyces sp. NPDC048275]|uniref:DUF4158 domain-containing protein n=1 Tax=Streptomyces sp. NPDC048275 TaxID=3155629 RepID=UPI0033C406E9
MGANGTVSIGENDHGRAAVIREHGRPRATWSELERFFFLDDVDRDLIALRRTRHHQLGFALQARPKCPAPSLVILWGTGLPATETRMRVPHGAP